MSLFSRLFRRKPKDQVFVRLAYEDGGTFLAGPMDHFSAEVYLVSRLGAYPFHNQRRVLSARIIGGEK